MEKQVNNIPSQYELITSESRQLDFNMASDIYTGSLLKKLVSSKPGGRILELGTGSGLAEPVPGNFRAREPECDGPFPNPRFGLPGPYTDRRSICAQRFEERSSRLHFVTHTCHRPGIHACSVCFEG